MDEGNHRQPGIGTLLGRLARTGFGAVENRFQLLTVEWQEERLRLTALLAWALGLVFLMGMVALLLTAMVIFSFAPEDRLFPAGVFAVLYLAGAVVAWVKVRRLLRQQPFAETLDQAKKDKEWFSSLG